VPEIRRYRAARGDRGAGRRLWAAGGFLMSAIGLAAALVGLYVDLPEVLGGGETSPPPPAARSGERAAIPVFDDLIGHLSDGGPFVRFTQDHDGEVVRIRAPVGATVSDGDAPRLDVWYECAGDPVALPADPTGSCFGIEFRVVPVDREDPPLQAVSGAHLDGWFVVEATGAPPHMGLNFTTLHEVTADRALELAG